VYRFFSTQLQRPVCRSGTADVAGGIQHQGCTRARCRPREPACAAVSSCHRRRRHPRPDKQRTRVVGSLPRQRKSSQLRRELCRLHTRQRPDEQEGYALQIRFRVPTDDTYTLWLAASPPGPGTSPFVWTSNNPRPLLPPASLRCRGFLRPCLRASQTDCNCTLPCPTKKYARWHKKTRPRS
jgi:hypothetical protein